MLWVTRANLGEESPNFMGTIRMKLQNSKRLLGYLENIGDGNTDFLALHDDFAAGDRPIVRQDPHLVVLLGVEFDNGASTHAQKLLHWQYGLAKHD